VDAIGTSPYAEMICRSLSSSQIRKANVIDLWNGMKKEAPEQLQKTMNILEWERTSYPEKHKADLDETSTCALLRAAILRHLGKFEEARTMLEAEILAHGRYFPTISSPPSHANLPSAYFGGETDIRQT
jgi:hypothetical protein